tara:strand:- start:7 stop:495 length:489 start_codon:yes stop_codon:yes gene_type:complete
MKSKAFTLIELLVVVAIIGILAAVGVTTFNGFQEKAKKSAAQSNFKMVIKYMVIENTKCEIGEEKTMDGNLTCSGRTIDTIMKAATKAFSGLKNPIDPNLPGIQINGCYDSVGCNLGVVVMHLISLKQIRFGICYKYECYENSAETNWKGKNNFFMEYVNFL